ncbi:MAG: class III lanthionine synthetase LanKC [Actinomycetales bacterium]
MAVRAEYYLGASADSPFYGPSQPGRGTDEGTRLQAAELPAGWLVQRWGGWEGWTPRDWRPRLQGWKIHVSATLDCAPETLARATRLCLASGVAFKFLPTRQELAQSSAKQGDRGSSGKFITIYPESDAQFADLVTGLEEVLRGQAGPYILSDLRVGQAPVFVRYGGIMAMNLPDANDQPVSAIADHTSLALIPDQRLPKFIVPEGVEIPEVLREAYRRSQANTDSRLREFTSIRPLHFSNAGGVYKATLPDGSHRVLREARPHAGLDGRERCALTRQLVEQQVLADLAGVPGVQQLVGAFTAWEHRYLELEYVPGNTLTSWVVRNILLQQDDPQEYTRRAVGIGRQLIDIVERIHETGWAVGDLHTGNLLVDDDDTVTILDLEDASRLDEPREIGFRVFEFCAQDEQVSAREADWFAVARCLMLMYVSDWEVEAVAPDFWRVALDKVRRDYGEQAAAQLEEIQGRYPRGTRSVLACDVPVGVFEQAPPAQQAVRQLTAGIDWSRTYGQNGSYPSDVVKPSRFVEETLAHGRAGVVLAQQRIGAAVRPDDVQALSRAARGWDESLSMGLYDGLAGLALVLGDAGLHQESVTAASLALRTSLGRHRLDLWGGQAGTALAAIEVARAAADDTLLDQALAVNERLHRTVAAPGSARTAISHKRGLFWGPTGLALTDLAAHLATGDDALLHRAVTRLREEVDNCVSIPTGETMVRDIDNNRVLPYVEWGSAGVWVVVTLAERLSGRCLLSDTERAGFALACSADFYIYPSLDHGRAGILTTLTAAGPQYHEEALRQSTLLRESLFQHDGMAFSIGDGLIRLSSDLATGAAGVALALQAHLAGSGYLNLPLSHDTALRAGRVPYPGAPVPSAAGTTSPATAAEPAPAGIGS